MSDYEELKKMIMCFRVTELQMLLTFAGSSKMGRKTELQNRALRLLDKPQSNILSMKIRELYRISGHSSSQSLSIPRAVVYPTCQENPRLSQDVDHYNIMQSVPNSSLAPLKPVLRSTNIYPVHPDVRLKCLPFYTVIAELLKTSTLAHVNMQVRPQEMSFMFHLTPEQANAIAFSRDFRNALKVEYFVQVQLRFCLLETSCEQDDNLPPNLFVKINDRVCPLPNPIPSNKPGVEPKRPPRPINITSLVKISPTVANRIHVSWTSDYGRNYCLAVYLVKKLTSSDLLEKLKKRGTRKIEHTKAMIKEKLESDVDNEIATMSLKVSLICPLGKCLMQIPCRATTCTHLQCFDASLFLQMNERRSSWICPVCDCPVSFENLVIDEYFTCVLQSQILTSGCNEVQLNMDGSWFPLYPKGSEETNKARISTICVQTVSDEDSIEVKDSPNSIPIPERSEKTFPDNNVELIDLVSDDEDFTADNVTDSLPQITPPVQTFPLPILLKTLSEEVNFENTNEDARSSRSQPACDTDNLTDKIPATNYQPMSQSFFEYFSLSPQGEQNCFELLSNQGISVPDLYSYLGVAHNSAQNSLNFPVTRSSESPEIISLD